MANRQKGFTLIELLVVISIIGILSTIAMTSLNSARKKARDARRKSDLNQMVLAMDQYYSDHGTYYIPGTGYNGGGTGWFNYIGGTNYTNSIANGLVSAGYFSTAPLDPMITSYSQTGNGGAHQYMYYVCSGGQGFYFYTHLESPNAADTAAMNASCSAGTTIQTSSSYLMNYAAGHR